MSPQLISSFYISRFAKDVSSPVTDLQAYRAGLVDENGNIIGSESSIDPYEYFVIKLKKIFSQLPMGTTKMSLNSFLSALKLFTEEASWYGIDKTEMTMFLEGYLASQGDGELSHISLLEDMGSGGGAGAIGVPAEAPGANTGGVSGFDPVMGQMQRRKAPVTDSTQMFEVDPDEYMGFKSAKAWKYVPEGPTRNYLQRYQRRNPEGKMAIKNSQTGEIHWLNLKQKSLGESLQESLNDATREFVNKVAGPNIVTPPEVDINPKTGKPKRGSRAQRVGYLFSGLSDLEAGADPVTTVDTLSQFAQSEVSASGMDTMCYDDKTGLFVPCDIKTHTTTPFGHIGRVDMDKIKGLEQLDDTVQQAIRDGNITEREKEKIRNASKALSSTPKNQESLANLLAAKLSSPYKYQRGDSTVSAPTDWFVFPGISNKPYNFGGVATIPSKNVKNFAKTGARAVLSPRFGQNRIEWKARGRDISSETAAEQLLQSGSRLTNLEPIAKMIEQYSNDPRLVRYLQDYYRMMRR